MSKIKRALISVSDKTGLVPFAKTLQKQKIEIFSTGGTLEVLRKAKIPAKSVSEITQFPEILEGRVKTLHPKIHGGILFRRGIKSHEHEVAKHKIPSIDMVVVNLYPFGEVIQKKGVKLETAIENIDIGGPTLLRAAAKNYESVVVVTDPKDYDIVLEELQKEKGSVSLDLRAKLAQKVFEATSLYDRMIAHYLKQDENHKGKISLPNRLDVIYEKAMDLRYGENPHQRAALYRRLGKPRFDFQYLHGKELSFNNLLDLEATIDTLREFNQIATCVIKHNNPCGIAEGKNLIEALDRAIDSDPMSAFGGIVGINRNCTLAVAKKLYERLGFLEVFVAPHFEPNALKFLKARKNIRLISIGSISEGGPWDLRFSKFGILLQDRNRPIRLHEAKLRKHLRCVTKTTVGKKEIDELLFAWRCVKMVRSNAIVITQNHQTVGIGAGQMSRVDAVDIACKKAGFRAEGAFLASDAFFPMPDSIELIHQAGIRAIIQPGGSIRDADVVQACDQLGIAMIFTGERHFRH
ncbi:MAG: bifunctional phosphoribosylaminoimidazolecarboxamide formyltransferase/IMP cyclohydrolase [Candidatus Omnitrophica bacterium]|nr:bifunctional phosphoribosylaminoimidazolecarboxamide formyltransferase/IMP cyclohydrolase [Candidatus Omnitrophota bacterium]